MAIKILNISVTNKKATYLTRQGDIVCGNSDYRIRFAFDSEWDGHDAKVARFLWNGHYTDVEFTGNEVDAPVISGATEVKVGVYTTGDDELHTTTSAVIPATPSILCEGGTVSTGTPSPGGGDSVEVVQETGSSTTAVMSQKATTDELGKKLDARTETSTYPQLYEKSQYGYNQLRYLQSIWQDDDSVLITYSAAQRDNNNCIQVGDPVKSIDTANKRFVEAVYRHDITLSGQLDYGDTFGCITASVYSRSNTPWSYDGYGCNLEGSHSATGFINIDGQRYWVVGISKATGGVASYIIHYAGRDTGAVERFIFIDGSDFTFNDDVHQMK